MIQGDQHGQKNDVSAIEAIKVDQNLEYLGSKEDSAETRTVATRKRIREQMHGDIDDFLANGGQINVIPSNVMADPPKRPANNYGGRPI